MLGLEGRVFGHANAWAIQNQLGIPQSCALFGVIAQGENGAVNVHPRVFGHGAAVGRGDVEIRVAVGLQHFGDLAQQMRPLCIAECAQGRTPLVASKGKTFSEVDARTGDTRQLGAQHGVEQGCAFAGAGLPASGKEVGKQGAGHVRGFLK